MELAEETIAEIVDDLQNEYGEAVRGIARFSEGEYRIDYLREDVQETLSENKVHEILEEAQFSSVGHPAYEDLYETELQAVIRIFERSVVMTIPVADNAGILVSLDRTATFRGRTVLELVKGGLPEVKQ